jgi:hypothetical protein
MTDIETLIAAQADPDQPAAMFAALDQALARSPGHILFTILAFSAAVNHSQRVYSNLPDAYPVGGRKPVTDAPWMRHVLREGKPWICRTRADVKEVFFDYELIWSLGCESMLNLPIRWRGETIGTLNLSHRAGYYDESHIPEVRHFGALALPALLSAIKNS